MGQTYHQFTLALVLIWKAMPMFALKFLKAVTFAYS